MKAHNNGAQSKAPTLNEIGQDVNESIWNSYRSLMDNVPVDMIDAHLQGFDIDPNELESMFETSTVSHERSPVSIANCTSYAPDRVIHSLRSILHQLGIDARVKSASRIFVKLGLIQPTKLGQHVTTTPRFLDALLSVLTDMSPHAEILVGDGSGHERDAEWVVAETGLRPVLRRYPSVEFVDLNVDDVEIVAVTSACSLPYLAVPRSILEADFLISLAKLKTHKWTGVSLGMKNMFGALPGSIYGFPKNRLHWASFPRVIADICSTLLPDLTLIDGIVGVEGNGPLNGHTKRSGVIIAGSDPVATDGIATQVMGIAPSLVPQFWFATKQKLGRLNDVIIDEQTLPMVKSYRVPPSMPWLYRSAFLSVDDQRLMAHSHLVPPFSTVINGSRSCI